MPELPEVQTIVSGLKQLVSGKRIQTVSFHRENIRFPLLKIWEKHIEGQSIRKIQRRAKLIVMTLDRGYLLWHMGMTGSLRLCRLDEPMRQHDHIELVLDDGRILRYHDPRRFGYLKYFEDEKALLDSFAHYGVEPLSNHFNGQYLWHLSRGVKQPIKNFIMNQKIVVGVGNIYACEALFIATIHPKVAAGNIAKQRYQALARSIKTVLQTAIEQGGTTLKDFENAEAKPGYFQQVLQVYGRKDLPCLTCQRKIKTIKLGGRNSFYCPNCQR